MSQTIERIKEIVTAYNNNIKIAEKKLHRTCRPLIEEAFKEIFDSVPQLQQFSWTQGTPGFNDGDPCYFSVHSDDIEMLFDLDGVSVESGDGCYYEELSYEECQEKLKEKSIDDDDLSIRITRLIDLFPSDFLLSLYGDGSKIIVEENSITVEDYYCE